MRDAQRPLRCAIYTRKSTDQGLEQDFNSLDAQREAAEAYIKSQAHEGWKLLPAAYDDGGYSGGNLERPALQCLLADVAAKRVDIVVVYKVDRLTRSLGDFAKLVELFDSNRTSFVSVTQQFNTTTSMGRLTLNMLLSFAQFEREVTAERIRDKIAASKRRGIFVGGGIPLGYTVQNKKLVIVDEEAVVVRRLYQRYLDLGSLTAVMDEMRAVGIVTKKRELADGGVTGGQPFAKGTLQHLLRNRLYLGELPHKGTFYPGEHPAIVARDLFDAVQARLTDQASHGRQRRAGSGALLTGRIYDDAGNRMTPSNAHKAGARYRYYVSAPLMQGQKDRCGSAPRASAPDVEALVLSAIRARVSDIAVTDQFDELQLVEQLIERVTIHTDEIKVTFNRPSGSDTLGETIAIPWARKTTRPKRELIGNTSESDVAPMDFHTRRTLVAAIAKARSWFQKLSNGSDVTLESLAAAEGRTERHVRMTLSLAFLAPDLVEAVLAGQMPHRWGMSRLSGDLPMLWSAQRTMVGAE